MNSLRYIVPIVVTGGLTAGCVFAVIWLIALVPPGEWSELIKAGIAIFVIGSTLLVVAWSAYFSYIIRQSLKA